jgi:hypothetical protein
VVEVCDLAYVMLLDQLERQVLADRHVAAVLMAAGAQDVPLPDFTEERARLDAALTEEPATVASHVEVEQLELRRALGVA